MFGEYVCDDLTSGNGRSGTAFGRGTVRAGNGERDGHVPSRCLRTGLSSRRNSRGKRRGAGLCSDARAVVRSITGVGLYPGVVGNPSRGSTQEG